VPTVATPRKTEFPISNASAPWTLRSAGGSRPTLIIWGTTARESVLERLARSGLAVLTPPEQATPADLMAALENVPAPVRVALGGTPSAEVSKILNAKEIPWRRVTSDWDDVPSWFSETQ